MSTPDQFMDKINTYSEKFNSVLDDFSSSYVNYQLNPGYSENQNIYSNNKAIIDALNADLFVATNNIQTNIDTLTGLISDLNTKIASQKTINTDLKSTLNQVSATGNGADLLIGEASDLYKMQRLSNITLAIGIFLILVTLFKVFSYPRTAV